MKKKAIIISAIIIVILVGIFFVRPSLARVQKDSTIQTITLAKNDLVDSVLVSGTVMSSNTKNVYSKLNAYSVKEVFVKVGDQVKAGDLLAQLDTASLESDIKQAELNVKNSQAALDNEAASNRSSLQNAVNSAGLASIELENARHNYETAKEQYNAGVSSQDALTQVETVLEKAQISYDNAQITLKNSQDKSLSITKNNLEIQKIALEKQKKNLSDAKITAPINGTVTLVNARAGESGTGLLFVVEDTDHLIVSTSIGEYDISLIKIDQEVSIKSDSTGDRQFSGVISKIAPTAQRDANGNIASTSNVQFDTEVELIDSDPNIKIGMNVRLTIKLNEKKSVYTVPYDAVISHDDGSKWIQVLESASQTGSAKNAFKEIPVKTGLETDMYVEISGADIKDGLQVLTNPQDSSKAAK